MGLDVIQWYCVGGEEADEGAYLVAHQIACFIGGDRHPVDARNR